jgi:hypothetical protein
MAVSSDEIELAGGYIDVTAEELIAAAAATGVAPSAQVVGPVPPDRDTVETAVRVGRRALLARGLMRGSQQDLEIDDALAESVSIAASPRTLTVISTVSAAERSMTWCYEGDEDAVVLSTLEPGLFRLRLLPAEALPAALEIIGGLDGATGTGAFPEFTVDVSGPIEAADGGGGDAESLDQAVRTVVDELDPAVLGRLAGTGGECTSVVVLRRGPDGAVISTETSWFRTDADEWSQVVVAESRVTGRPTDPAALREQIIDALGSAPHF